MKAGILWQTYGVPRRGASQVLQSRSDLKTVAVGFKPTGGVRCRSRRGATLERLRPSPLGGFKRRSATCGRHALIRGPRPTAPVAASPCAARGSGHCRKLMALPPHQA